MGNPTLFADAAAPAAAGYAHGTLDVARSSGSAEESPTPSLRGEDPWAASPEDPSWLHGHEAWPASLDPSCLLALEKLSAAGLALSEAPDAPVFSLRFGGEVPRDGSCLFAAVAQAAGLQGTAAEIRHRCVKRVVADAGAGLLPPGVEASVKSLYSPDLVRRSQRGDMLRSLIPSQQRDVRSARLTHTHWVAPGVSRCADERLGRALGSRAQAGDQSS
jgi:hypothetical protein